ncbi:MAG TPA: NINE protein [Verrucomicrobiae bacterium]|nr:NINE protein [Verrucomicrobiae bacterium]
MIGADGRQYGPVSAEQLRQWITEGRASPLTLVQPEGGTDWKPLASFSEFTPLLPLASPVPPVLPSPHRKSKVAAGLLGILLGGWGIHRFYLGYVGVGIAQIVVTLVTCGVGALWGFIEGILILAGSTITTDAGGQPLTD